MKHQSIVAAVLSEPWAIHPPKLAEICAFLAARAADRDIDPERVAELAQAAQERRRQSERAVESIAVIPILGTIYHRASGMTRASGLTTTESIRRALRAALEDESVKAVVLDIDSPGGAVYGTAETAREIRRARQKKPVHASVNGMAASAAYYMASQASRVFMSPASEVGSIGVIMAHEDWSKALEEEGVKITLVTAGKHKGETNPYSPLSDEGREAMQEAADDWYEMFTADVAKGRNTTQARVKRDFGEGRLLRAEKALAAGMVDKIGTLDEVIAEALVDVTLKGRAQSVANVTQFEELLHSVGFTRSQAAALANRGFYGLCQGEPDEAVTAPAQGEPEPDQSQGEPDQPISHPKLSAERYLAALKTLKI